MTDPSLIALLAETRGLILSTAPNNKKREDILDRLAAALAREQEAQPPVCALCGFADHVSTCPNFVPEAAQRKTLEQMAAEAALEQDPELAQPAAQEPDELLREWIEAIGVNPELNRWHVSREDVLQLIRTARSKP